MNALNDVITTYTRFYRNGPEATINGAEVSREEVMAVMGDTAEPLGQPVDAVNVVELFGYPPVSEAKPNEELVDMLFLTVGVDRAAKEHVAEIRAALAEYPDQERLAGGPSYIEIGAVLGSQDQAIALIALGKVVGLWDVISGLTLGMSRDVALELAGQGMLMASGYRREEHHG